MPCPRCAGLMIVLPLEHIHEYEKKCLLCGHREFPTVAEPIDNLRYRWESVKCEKCHVNAAQRGREKCLVCSARDRGRSHSQMIKDGMRLKKEEAARCNDLAI